MAKRRQVILTPEQRQELLHLSTNAPKPYLRERASAILLVANGMPGAAVARRGLRQRRKPDTVYDWLNRYLVAGCDGLHIRGRGRKTMSDSSGLSS